MSQLRVNIQELGLALVHGRYKSTFKWWIEGDCACGAIREVKYFDKKPTENDLIESISK